MCDMKCKITTGPGNIMLHDEHDEPPIGFVCGPAGAGSSLGLPDLSGNRFSLGSCFSLLVNRTIPVHCSTGIRDRSAVHFSGEDPPLHKGQKLQ